MRKSSLILLLSILGLFSCEEFGQQKETARSNAPVFQEVIKEDYELYKPLSEVKAVLILFGGYPETIEDVKREFTILDTARDNDIAVLFLNYNQKLWLTEDEKYELAGKLQNILIEQQLPHDNIIIGGFSSGGLVSLLISNFIVGMKQFYIDPKAVFIADSPIDLLALYRSSEKNIEHDFSEVSVQESSWLIEHLETHIGDPLEDIENYEDKAVFTYKTNNTSNLDKLKNTRIRFYTEPDTLWWKENRMEDYEQTNAFYIEKLGESLVEKGFENVEYIPTTNKGYRANGERHPHSWSIVDKKDLIDWILEK